MFHMKSVLILQAYKTYFNVVLHFFVCVKLEWKWLSFLHVIMPFAFHWHGYHNQSSFLLS